MRAASCHLTLVLHLYLEFLSFSQYTSAGGRFVLTMLFACGEFSLAVCCLRHSVGARVAESGVGEYARIRECCSIGARNLTATLLFAPLNS